jgi:hypothetical protein
MLEKELRTSGVFVKVGAEILVYLPLRTPIIHRWGA